jgi:succinate dehydrogenase / fumarate reductase cytochrome b subunit
MDRESTGGAVPRPNRLGIRGWVYAGRYSFERYLYVLHRVTGVGLILYLLLHIFETGQRMRGEETWESLMALFAQPAFVVVEYLLFVAFVFHAANGIRLAVTELGFFLGTPSHPVYPYASSVKRHRPLTYAMMALAAVLVVLGAFGFVH